MIFNQSSKAIFKLANPVSLIVDYRFSHMLFEKRSVIHVHADSVT